MSAERLCWPPLPGGGVRRMGEPHRGERAGQGWPAPALPAMQDCIAEQAALEPTGTYLRRAKQGKSRQLSPATLQLGPR